MSNIAEDYGIIGTAYHKLEAIEKEIVCSVKGEDLSFYAPINVDQAGPNVIISGIALTEGKFRDVYYPYEEIKKSIKRLLSRDYVVQHGQNLRWKDKVIGKIFEVEASDILRSVLFKAEITNEVVGKEILSGKWKGNSVRVRFDEQPDDKYGIRAVNLEYDNVSLTDIPACRSCIIIQKELKTKLHDLSLDGGNKSTMSGEPDNKDNGIVIDKINETLKGNASKTDKLNAINDTITQERLKNMDTPEMFGTVITRLDKIETRLQQVEPSDPKREGGNLGDKEQDKEGSSGQPPKENPKMPDNDKPKEPDKPKDDKTKGDKTSDKPKDPDVPKTPDKPEDPKDPKDPKDPDPKDADKPQEPTVVAGDTEGITPQRVEIIISQAPVDPTTPPPTTPPTEPPTPPASPTTPPKEPDKPPATPSTPPEDPEKPPNLEEDFKASALMIKAWRPDIKPVERNPLTEKKKE